jgi:hypothetical protein
MTAELLDERTADAIVSGGADLDDLASPLRHIAALVETARGPAVPGELAGEDVMVASFITALTAARTVADADLRRRRAKRRAAKAIAALAILTFTGTAAAASNHLPDSVQTAVADVSSHVGIHLPKPKHAPKTSDDPSSDDGTDAGSSTGNGPDATGPAKAGLCTAHFARGTSPSEHAGGVAEQNLEAAAADAGQTVDEYCAASAPQPPESDSTESSSAESDAPDGGPANPKSQKPADPGKPDDGSTASSSANNGKKPETPNGKSSDSTP